MANTLGLSNVGTLGLAVSTIELGLIVTNPLPDDVKSTIESS